VFLHVFEPEHEQFSPSTLARENKQKEMSNVKIGKNSETQIELEERESTLTISPAH
jgi:hypothetical protein